MSSPDPAQNQADVASSDGSRTRVVFATTCWSMVLAASQAQGATPSPALETLCRAYWFPVYAFLRRRGHQPADAEDLTQGFFAQLLSRSALGRADPERGRFRSFLLACLNHYVMDQADKARTQRRGGGQSGWSPDLAGAEVRYESDVAHAESADRAFDRQWAVATMERALERLRREQEEAGRGPEFAALERFLVEPTAGGDYREPAAQTGLSPNAVGVAVYRLRRRFRECVRMEVAETLSQPGDVEEEMSHLLLAMR